MKTIAFFGHRRIFNKATIKTRLIEVFKEIIPQGFTRILIGSHGDFDKLALSTSLEYKKHFDKNIEINVVLTSLSFLTKDQYGYGKLDFYKEKGCETVFYDIEEVYYKNRIIFSNKKMIDESDLIICFVDMKSYNSGAKTAINYAIKENKKIINLFYE